MYDRKYSQIQLWEKGLYNAFRRYHPDVFAHPQEGFPKHLSDKRLKRFILICKKYDVVQELNPFPLNGRLDRLLKLGKKYQLKFSLGSDFHGFKPHIRELLSHIYEMFEIVSVAGPPKNSIKRWDLVYSKLISSLIPLFRNIRTLLPKFTII
ncbi:MAG: hypothetical protein ACOC2U_03695 [bacterium]